MPKVSVLMPVFNTKEEYLRESIHSILNQTFNDFEFIIINDGSVNNAKDVILSYCDNRIKYFEQDNHGLVYTLNRGISLCNGEYIARMDSDDISLPERFARQVEILERNPEIGIVGGLISFFPDSKFEKKYEQYPRYLDLLRECQVAHPVVMMRKSVLDRFNLRYDNDYLHVEDYELWSRLIRYTEFHNIQDILLKYRVHEESVSFVFSEMQNKNTLRIRQKMLDFLTKDKNSQEKIEYFIFSERVKQKHYSLLERIFSIKNEKDMSGHKYKVITLIGFQFKVKGKRK